MKVDQNSLYDDGIKDVNDIDKIMNSGRYEKVAEILESEQSKQEAAGNSLLSEFLGMARQISLACQQSRSERAWYRRAEELAGSREERMRNQLQSMLEMIAEGDAKLPADDTRAGVASAGKPGRHSIGSGIFKLIQNLITSRNSAGIDLRREAAGTGSEDQPESDVKSERSQPHPGQAGRSIAVGNLDPDMTVDCLGRFQVYDHGRLISNWHSLKAKSIFKYLIAHRYSEISKEFLMELFWPETDPDSARRNLHQAIYSLRQTLRQNKNPLQPVQFNDNCYSINQDLHLRIDFEEFEKHAQAGIQLEIAGFRDDAVKNYMLAEDIYQGDFLEDEVFEDWTNIPRERYRNLYLDIADRLSEILHREGDLTTAIEFCQKILARDNCHEGAHCRLMQCFEKLGQRNHVVRQYQLCVQFLKRELDVDPSEETRNLFNQIMKNSQRARALSGR